MDRLVQFEYTLVVNSLGFALTGGWRFPGEGGDFLGRGVYWCATQGVARAVVPFYALVLRIKIYIS